MPASATYTACNLMSLTRHKRSVPSSEHVASKKESGEKCTEVTIYVCSLIDPSIDRVEIEYTYTW